MEGVLALQKLSMTLFGAGEEDSTCSVCCNNSTSSAVSSTKSVVVQTEFAQ